MRKQIEKKLIGEDSGEKRESFEASHDLPGFFSKRPEIDMRNTPEDHADCFCTYDLGCSAALISAGFELISLDKENRRKVQFIFHRKFFYP